jgi:hypothetical protein
VALYWGSFRRVAAGDPDFDWEEEIWETLTHELQHHVESLAGDGRLIEQDLLDAQAFEREEADAWDDGWRASSGGGRGEEAAEAHGGPQDDDRDEDGAASAEGRGADGGGLGGLLRRVFGGGRD